MDYRKEFLEIFKKDVNHFISRQGFEESKFQHYLKMEFSFTGHKDKFYIKQSVDEFIKENFGHRAYVLIKKLRQVEVI